MPIIAGTMTSNGVKYRVVKNVEGAQGPVVEKCIGVDAMNVEGWTRLHPQSEQADLWNALQAALTRL